MELSRIEKHRLSRIASLSVEWYMEYGRVFPWRWESVSNYEKVCVEVLLQQTRAETVGAFYPKFFSKYPNWRALAYSEESELQDLLRPIGLWRRRAKSLKNLAEYAVRKNEVFPTNIESLLDAPAVGHYVANAIKLFYHEEPAPLLDSNMSRVIERNLGPRELADIRYDPWLKKACDYLVRRDNSKLINWAILDLAALVCKTRNPCCDSCPLSSGCKKLI